MAMRCRPARRSGIPPIPTRLLLGLMLGPALSPGAATAQYMALTPLPTSNAPRMPAPDAPKPAPLQARPAKRAFTGSLPHQRTGPSHIRAVRDICIGCDR